MNESNTYTQMETSAEQKTIEVGKFSNNNHCYYIGPQKLNRNAYKYMDLETAMLCIKYGNIRFAQPDTWPDKYEGRFYNADYSNVSHNKGNTPKLYACCITFTGVSEAAWNTYTYNKSGIGARCVQFKFDKTKFRKALDKYATLHKKECTYEIYEGAVSYDYSDYQIDGIHLKKSSLYNQYFNNFHKENYLSLLLIKRPAFKYEEEYRFFIIPGTQSKLKPYIDINVPWKDIIKEIRVDERCSDVEIEAFKEFCRKYGINEDLIIKLNLHSNPQPNITIE